MNRIAIVGVGGIGGYLGARLAHTYQSEADTEIVFVQRGEHGQVLKREGIILLTQHHRYMARPDRIIDGADGQECFTHVIFCVKSYDLESAAGMIREMTGPETVIISALNGIGIDDRLRVIFPQGRILPGCIYVSAHIQEPGTIRQVGGAGPFYFGPVDGGTGEFEPTEALLKKAQIKAKLVSDIMRRVWEKYVFVSALASVTSFFRVPAGEIITNDEMKRILSTVIDEIITIASSLGVQMEPSLVDDIFHRLSVIPPETRTSMQNDLEKGKRAELDVFTGYIVTKGKELGMPTPMHDRILHRLDQDFDSGMSNSSLS